MKRFLSGVPLFLAHDHPSAVAFLTCCHHNFHGSIIPEFLSDEEGVKSFCEARQQNQLTVDKGQQYLNLYNLFVQTPLMQFSLSLLLVDEDCAESILKPLLETKYFYRTLQRCSVVSGVPLTNELFQGLSKVKSLTNLDLGWSEVENEHLGIIINCFPSLETLTIENAESLDSTISSPPPPATKTLRNLTLNSTDTDTDSTDTDTDSADTDTDSTDTDTDSTDTDTDSTDTDTDTPPTPPATKTLRSLEMRRVDPLFATLFVPHFTNLRKLVLRPQHSCQELDLLPLSSSLPFLTELKLDDFALKNTESLKNFVHLSSLCVRWCQTPDSLSFLVENSTKEEKRKVSLPKLETLRIDDCRGLSTSSFASLAHAPDLRVLTVNSDEFNNECLQYLHGMVHLRKLTLSQSGIVGDNHGSLTTLMQNLFQLEELNLCSCRIGNQGAIAGALYSIHSRLRELNLSSCNLVDDDLNGIGALKNSLEELNLASNENLTNEGLMFCKDLVKLTFLSLSRCDGIDDLSPLKHCLNLEELNVSLSDGVSVDSFKVFSEEPNSFPNLRVLDLSNCVKLKEKVLEHLSKNNNLVHQLKMVNVWSINSTFLFSETAKNNIYQLKGLRQIAGFYSGIRSKSDENKLARELLRNLKNLERP